MSTQNKTEILHKEIDLIQNCITRMASNSFLIKGWYFTLIIGFITFGHKKFNTDFMILISLSITFFCWISDTFFLQLERKYRKKYSWIIRNRESSDKLYYNLDPNEEQMWSTNDKIEINFFEVLFSKTLLFLYIIIPLFIMFLTVYL
ncbi:MAG: hypothetical protein ACRC5W_01240 [Cetobacterium sp.]